MSVWPFKSKPERLHRETTVGVTIRSIEFTREERTYLDQAKAELAVTMKRARAARVREAAEREAAAAATAPTTGPSA